MRCCEIGPSVASSLQKSQCTIQTLQLRKWKPLDFNTITEHASTKPGEEAKLLSLLPPAMWCCLTHCYSEGDTDLCLLFPSLPLWLFIVYTLWQGEIHYRFLAAVGPLPQSIYPSVSSCKTQGSWYLFTSWEEESVLTPPVRSDVISGKGRALEALSWPRHMRYVRGRESQSDDRAGQV